MSPARKAFVWVFLVCIGLGILVGLIELVAPDYATVTLNGESVTGMTGFLTAVVSGAIPGLIFGLIIAGIVKLVTRKPSKPA